jgi:hypothetical protein
MTNSKFDLMPMMSPLIHPNHDIDLKSQALLLTLLGRAEGVHLIPHEETNDYGIDYRIELFEQRDFRWCLALARSFCYLIP